MSSAGLILECEVAQTLACERIQGWLEVEPILEYVVDRRQAFGLGVEVEEGQAW